MALDVQAALIECWVGADAHSFATALKHTIDLFVRVSECIAAGLGERSFDSCPAG
jgi:hypothetical protein